MPGSTFTTSMGLPPSSERRIGANDPLQRTRNLNEHSVFFYVNPTVNVLIGGRYVSKTLAQNAPLTVEVLYAFIGVMPGGNDQQINNLDDANRINKTDTTTLTAGSFNATLAAPAVTTADLASFVATWREQSASELDESKSGYARIALDAASLTSIGQSGVRVAA
jgi:hypothetical protein